MIPIQQCVAEREGWAEAGRVHPDDLHLTLAFLGDREAEAFDRIARALAGADLAGLAQTLSCRGVDVWGGRQRVCVAVFAMSRTWTTVLHRIWESLEPSGWTPPTQRFRPHVTLWRTRDAGAAKPSGQGVLRAMAFRASALGLMARDESSRRQRYRTLWQRAVSQPG